MPCKHRFQEDLYPEQELKHLFIGTFNPEWNNLKGNNANWFYGRHTNSFWNIMPSVFGHPNMNTAKHRQNPNIWKQYCIENGIGLTDIIESINDADQELHFNEIISFLDDKLEKFQKVQLTDIPRIIRANSKSLCGVYLTRYAHGLIPNGIFFNRWTEIQNLCNELGIYHSSLVTPSNGYMMPVQEKIRHWQKDIKSCTKNLFDKR